MISCIAVDDEPIALDIIRDHVSKTSFLELKSEFRSALDALTYIAENKVDLVFLDVNMPDLNGVQFAKLMSSPKPYVVFCTAYAQYAVESYELEALDYLLKPVEFDRFMKTAFKVKAIIDSKTRKAEIKDLLTPLPMKSEFTLIKSGTEIQKIDLDEISYIEGTGNYVTIQTQSKRIMSLQSMKELLRQLPEKSFFRIHKSFIISFKFLDIIENHQVKIGNKVLPIGSTYRNEFMVWLNKER